MPRCGVYIILLKKGFFAFSCSMFLFVVLCASTARLSVPPHEGGGEEGCGVEKGQWTYAKGVELFITKFAGFLQQAVLFFFLGAITRGPSDVSLIGSRYVYFP
uniref:Uncharacterized protein n=1 Tax=Leishmania guyanensis TaxID=5670 RepID=A0A1E1IWD4_LEIGU|nr:Hypothetical protein BN36_2231090 [Leishmania guyanensis]